MANLFEPPHWIAIEGPVRAGKSTLAALLASQTGARRIVEPEDNPFLEGFYRGDKSQAFPAQMWFLTARFDQMRTAAHKAVSTFGDSPVVADYIFEKDKLYASLNLSDDELALYTRYYAEFERQLPRPELVIYLRASVKTLRTRLKRKAAPGERSISDSYLEQVVQAYEHFFFHYTSSDLLVVNTDDIDFVRNNRDLQMLLRRLGEPVSGKQYFLPLGSSNAKLHRGAARLGTLAPNPMPPRSSLRTFADGFAPGVVRMADRVRRAL